MGSLILAACWATVLADQHEDGVPKKLTLRIGGMLGSTFRVELVDGALVYKVIRAREPSEPVKVAPTPEQWREFRAALDALNVWEWKGDYLNRKVFDGTQWELKIEYPDRSLAAMGSNSYPDDEGKANGKPEFTAAFARYLNAVEKLIGGRVFR